MLVQKRLSGVSFMELNERERVQEMCRQRLPTFGELVKEPKRPFGPLVEHRCGGGQQEKAHIRGTGRHSLFGKWQNTRPAGCVRKRREQAVRPDPGRVREEVCLPQSWACHGPPNQTRGRESRLRTRLRQHQATAPRIAPAPSMVALARSGRNLCILFCGFPVRCRAKVQPRLGGRQSEDLEVLKRERKPQLIESI